jgi:hypothetical protein
MELQQRLKLGARNLISGPSPYQIWVGAVKSLRLTGTGPVGLVHTQNFPFSIRKPHLAALADVCC